MWAYITIRHYSNDLKTTGREEGREGVSVITATYWSASEHIYRPWAGSWWAQCTAACSAQSPLHDWSLHGRYVKRVSSVITHSGFAAHYIKTALRQSGCKMQTPYRRKTLRVRCSGGGGGIPVWPINDLRVSRKQDTGRQMLQCILPGAKYTLRVGTKNVQKNALWNGSCEHFQVKTAEHLS